MEKYIGQNDDVGKLVMSLGSVSKGFGGQGQRMGENASFNVKFRDNADTEVVNYFRKIYGDAPEKISFYLPSEDIDKCIIAPYTAFNSAKTLLATSDGEYFTYIANQNNPLDTRNPYLRNGVRCSDGQKIRHQPTLDFLGKPKAKMIMSGQMFVFVKELIEVGVFQTLTVKFHTTRDRDMLRKRLEFTRQFASSIGVPLTAVPFFITKYKARTSYIDPSGNSRQSEHFYLDLGMVHSIGSSTVHPLGTALSAFWKSIGNEKVSEEIQPEPEKTSSRMVVVEETAPFEDDDISSSRPMISYEDASDEDDEDVYEAEGAIQQQPAQQPQPEENKPAQPEWKKKLFVLSQEQKEFVKENISSIGANAAVLPEYLDEFKDKNGTPVTELSFEQIVEQMKLADEFVANIANGKVSVGKDTETKAKMRRGAMITAGLILKNKYVFY
jgi:hypothetical protein